jgi:SAM-dependent methyltransferase
MARKRSSRTSRPSTPRLHDLLLAALERHGPGGAGALREIAKDASVGEETRALVIGGAGRTACDLARDRGCPVTAAVASEPVLEATRARVEREGLADRVTARLVDPATLLGGPPLNRAGVALGRPFDPGAFDFILWDDPLARVDLLAAARAIRPLLAPGGALAAVRLAWLRPPAPEVQAPVEALRPGDPPRVLDDFFVALGEAEFGGGVAWALEPADWDRFLAPLGAALATPAARAALEAGDEDLARLAAEHRVFSDPATRAALGALAVIAQRQEPG